MSALPYSNEEYAAFVRAYLEAIIFVMDEEQVEPESTEHLWSLLSPEEKQEIGDDCTGFIEGNLADLRTAEALGDYAQRGEWTTPERAGHDFLLTRNGHGAGFWDRGLGEVGDRLSEAAKVYGSQSIDEHEGAYALMH